MSEQLAEWTRLQALALLHACADGHLCVLSRSAGLLKRGADTRLGPCAALPTCRWGAGWLQGHAADEAPRHHHRCQPSSRWGGTVAGQLGWAAAVHVRGLPCVWRAHAILTLCLLFLLCLLCSGAGAFGGGRHCVDSGGGGGGHRRHSGRPGSAAGAAARWAGIMCCCCSFRGAGGGAAVFAVSRCRCSSLPSAMATGLHKCSLHCCLSCPGLQARSTPPP